MNRIISILIIFLTHISYSQDVNPVWTDFRSTSKYSIYQNVTLDSTGFITAYEKVTNTSVGTKREYQLIKFGPNGETVSSIEIPIRTKVKRHTKVHYIETISSISCLFSGYDDKKGEMILYSLKINSTPLELGGEITELSRFKVNGNLSVNFNISMNKKKSRMLIHIPYSSEFIVLDADCNLISKHTPQILQNQNLSAELKESSSMRLLSLNHVITNEGNIYIIYRPYLQNLLEPSNLSLHQTYIYSYDRLSKEEKTTHIDIGNEFIRDARITELWDGSCSLTGIYYEKNLKGSRGLFSSKLSNSAISELKKFPFPKRIVELKKSLVIDQIGKESISSDELEFLQIDKVIQSTTGGLYHVSQVAYDFDYEHLSNRKNKGSFIIGKFDAQGELKWITKIHQESSSQHIHVTDSKIFFNNSLNLIYSESDLSWKQGSSDIEQSGKAKNYFSVLTSIDQTGKFTKKKILTTKKIEDCLYPSFSIYDENIGLVLFHPEGNKERIGILNNFK